MPLIYADRVRETTSTTGTGTLTLSGAVSGFQSFSAVGNGNKCFYRIENGSAWEIGIGTYTSSGTTLSRDVILGSTNSGSAITLSGSSEVFLDIPATFFSGQVRVVKARVAATANVTLSTDCENGDTLNGVTLATGDVVFTPYQTTAADRRLWVVKASGSPDPHPLMPTGDVISSFLVIVEEGTTEKDLIWLQTANTATVGSGDLTWSVINQSALVWSVITDGAAFVIDWTLARKQQVTIGANRSPSFSGAVVGQAIRLKVAYSGAYSITWPSGITWAGGTAPTQTSTNAKFDEYIFDCVGSGAYTGYVIALNTSTAGMS